MGTGFQVLAAAESAARNSTVDEVVESVSDVRERVRVLAMLDSLAYLRRSGRVSWVQASLGNLLSIKTFIELRDSQVRRLDQVRTRRKGIEHLTDLIFRFPPLEDLAILHSGADQDAADLGHAVASQVGVEPRIINITTVIGTHVGPGGLGCAAVLKKSVQIDH
jgi:DegV family protein with EDD domain